MLMTTTGTAEDVLFPSGPGIILLHQTRLHECLVPFMQKARGRPDEIHYTKLEDQSSIPGVGYRGSRPAPPLLRSRISPCSADRRVDSVPPRRLPHRLAFN
ncbi:hypothetical protein ACOMHN_008780 [Nucella lapillus]